MINNFIPFKSAQVFLYEGSNHKTHVCYYFKRVLYYAHSGESKFGCWDALHLKTSGSCLIWIEHGCAEPGVEPTGTNPHHDCNMSIAVRRMLRPIYLSHFARLEITVFRCRSMTFEQNRPGLIIRQIHRINVWLYCNVNKLLSAVQKMHQAN